MIPFAKVPAHPLARWLLFGAALFLTLALFLPERTLFDGYDWSHLHVFYKAHYRQALLHGSLPQWNPFVALGRPYLADIETAVFYPPNLFYLAGTGPGVGLTLWFHFSLLLAGMLRLARQLGCREMAAWFGALGFALGAPLLGRLQSGQMQVFCAMCWIPWVFLSAGCALARPGERTIAGFATVMALFFLAGSPPVFWLTAWGGALVLGLRIVLTRFPSGMARGAGGLTLGAVLAAGLVAVQLLPFLELVAEGNRQGQDPTFALANNQPAQVALSLLTAKLPGGFFYWEYNLHAGLLLVLLALASLWRGRSAETFALWCAAAVFLILAAGAATPLLPVLATHVPGWGSFRYPSRYGIITAFALCLLAAHGIEQLAHWLESRRPAAAAWTPVLIGALLLINVADNCRAYLDRATLYSVPPPQLKETQLAGELQAAGLLRPGQPPPRVLAPPWLVREDSGLRYGYSTVAGFANPFLARVWRNLHEQAGLRPSATDPVNLPLAMYAAPVETFAGLGVAARWDPRLEQFVINSQPAARARLEPAPVGGGVTIEHFAGDRIVLRARSPAPSRLVVAEPWYPGWQAFIDGQPATVDPIHGWMRASDLPAGDHRIELVFRSRRLQLGAAITLGSLLLTTALWLRRPPAGGLAPKPMNRLQAGPYKSDAVGGA